MRAEQRRRRRRLVEVLEELGYRRAPVDPELGAMIRFVHQQRARRRFVSLLARRSRVA